MFKFTFKQPKYKSVRATFLVLSALLSMGITGLRAQQSPPPRASPASAPLDESFRVGQKFTVNGRTLFVQKLDGNRLILTPPQPLTESLGTFIQPVDVKSATGGQGRPLIKIIDGSGLGELFPGAGVYVHTANVYETGASMWNFKTPQETLTFDLGKEFNVAGAYVWNYNEPGGWTGRGAHNVSFSGSLDGKTYAPLGDFALGRAPGSDDYRGDTLAFAKPMRARYLQMLLKDNYGGDEMGLSEVRFANGDEKVTAPGDRKPKYARPQHPQLGLGAPLAGSENIVYPADAGLIDVTKAPYNAKGNGKTDDTTAIQSALTDHPNQGAIIYLPNGVYLVSHTLHWGGSSDMSAGDAFKQTVLQGQSQRGTIIQLKDSAPEFGDPRDSHGVIYTGAHPAQRFGNEVCNLTVDTGLDNPGATGVQFIANNQGGMRDVTIVSGDGYGPVGLDMGYTDEQGPCLIKNVSVIGFDTGVRTAFGVASVVMENVTVENQNKIGLENGGQPLSVRGLKSINGVPAVNNGGGLLTLIDSTLEGKNPAQDTPALINSAVLLARNVKTSGYTTALNDRTNSKILTSPNIAEYRSVTPPQILAGADKTLGLPIKDTPELPWDDPKTWVSPLAFGGKPNDGQNDADAIQKAIDSGATTVYLPHGEYNIDKTIVLRGAVRRFIGCKATLRPAESLTPDQPLFRFEDGTAPLVSIERINTDFSFNKSFLTHASKRTLVLRNIGCNFLGGEGAYSNTGTGPLFIEDVVMNKYRFKNQQVWARQFNVEQVGTHTLNDGGDLWVLGMKVETGGTVIETKNGGQTEILGGLSQTNNGKLAPMFVNSDSNVSLTFAEVNNSDDPFLQFVIENRGAQTKEWGNPDANFKGFRPVIYESRLKAK